MNRTKLAALLIVFASSIVATSNASAADAETSEWVMYTEAANGDAYFYDTSRVEKTDTLRHVWNGIRYKTSLMGAFSFVSLLEINCSKWTETTLQSTFFSDKNWENAAMKTDTSKSATRQIEAGSTVEQLAGIVCDQ